MLDHFCEMLSRNYPNYSRVGSMGCEEPRDTRRKLDFGRSDNQEGYLATIRFERESANAEHVVVMHHSFKVKERLVESSDEETDEDTIYQKVSKLKLS